MASSKKEEGKKPARAKAAASNTSAKKRQKPEKNEWNGFAMGIIVVAIVALLIIGYLIYVQLSLKESVATTSFPVFQKNFIAANSIGVYVYDTNSTVFSSTEGCGAAFIEEMQASSISHKPPTAIKFFVLNDTSCTYTPNGLGSNVSDYSNTTASSCIAMASGKSMSSVFIQYNSTGNSTRILPYRLYYSGQSSFLAQCGIAYEIGAAYNST